MHRVQGGQGGHVLNDGDKVLIFHRRAFDADPLRFFVGTVNECEGGLAAVVGHAWIQDVHRGAFTRKPDMRTRVVALTSGHLTVYKLARHVSLDDLTVEYGAANEALLTDGGDFRMDITDRT
jgi:hypothetical protein